MSIEIQPTARPWEVVPDSDYLRFQIVTAREVQCMHPQCSQRVADAIVWLSIGRHRSAEAAATFVDEQCPDHEIAQVVEPAPVPVQMSQAAQEELVATAYAILALPS